ncbi:MAG: Gfo/Idh/MocA family oxidoreductase [Actinomycetes bacterium]
MLIVGCGSIGKRHARVLNGLGVRDLRACDPQSEQRESLLAQVPTVRMVETYEAGLADRPDTVLIGTPPWLHIPQAAQAIRAGCHVLSEKPLSDSTDGMDDLVALAAAENKKVMVAHCFRYHDGLLKAKQILEAGRVGRLVSVRALMGEHLPDVRPDYRSLFSAQHGGAFDLMHDIDLAIWYAGLPVKQVYALSGSYSDIGITAPDVAEILIGFEGRGAHDRCLATVHLDFFQRPRRRQIELIGAAGVIIVEFAAWDRCTVSVYEAAKAAWGHEELVTDRDDMFRAEDREFLRAVAEDLPIRCTIAEARKSVEVVLACQK